VASLVSELTDEQIRYTLMRELDLNYAIPSLGRDQGEHEMLRLYHSLSRAQKTQLADENGLAFGDLSSKQWDTIAQIVSDRFAGAYLTEGSVSLKTTTTASATFHITGTIQDQQPQEFKVGILLHEKAKLAGKIKARQDARAKAQQPAPPADKASPAK
jgi:hypothetical protein